WVKVPTLSHTADTVIYLFYGNPSVSSDQSNASAVWDTSYLAVWHMNNASSPATDSTGHGHSASGSNSPTFGVSGRVGNAVSFNGSNQYLSGADTNFPSGTAARTISGWYYLAANVSGHGAQLLGYGTASTDHANGPQVSGANPPVWLYEGWVDDLFTTFTP